MKIKFKIQALVINNEYIRITLPQLFVHNKYSLFPVWRVHGERCASQRFRSISVDSLLYTGSQHLDNYTESPPFHKDIFFSIRCIYVSHRCTHIYITVVLYEFNLGHLLLLFIILAHLDWSLFGISGKEYINYFQEICNYSTVVHCF